MYTYLLLGLSIVAEVIGTSALKVSSTSDSWVPIGVVAVFYSLAFLLLLQVIKTLPIGVTYAVWSGLGTALIVIVGAMLFKEAIGLVEILGIGLIIVGVTVLNLFGSAH